MDDKQKLEAALGLLERIGASLDDILYVAEVGSTAHGAGVGDDDLDMAVIRMEKWEELVYPGAKGGSVHLRTQEGNKRSGPGDVDLQVVTLRRYSELMMKGNPSIISIMSSRLVYHFNTRAKRTLLSISDGCRSKKAAWSFYHYMENQVRRWENGEGRKVNRPELVEKFGFDTKYAYHALRLGFQGIEYIKTGMISMPIPEPERSFLVDVRNGAVTESAALKIASDRKDEMRALIESSTLPDASKLDEVTSSVCRFYRSWYS